jgi:alkylation response protein AidB-like acyl-CoA dehydrogenase
MDLRYTDEEELFRAELRAWLESVLPSLPPKPAPDDWHGRRAYDTAWQRMLFDAGYAGINWPEEFGGRGASPSEQLIFLEESERAHAPYVGVNFVGLLHAGPTLIAEAGEEQRQRHLPAILRGDEVWCQGFSEPSTGSNLGALTCKAVRSDAGWRVTGQKVWTSLAQYAQRCVLLTRSGTPESAHRGITALLVDMDTPGITPRPIETMHGEPEFCEVFFDDVLVPFDRTLGNEGDGWAFAMDLLPYERSTSLWQRAAFLHRRLAEMLEQADAGLVDPGKLGEVTQLVYAFRARSRATVHRMAAGETLGVETSIDKVLLASSEQAVFDLVADALPEAITVGDDVDSTRWRSEFLYSRAASIYGGSSEIQRNIIARRLLDLGNDR